VKPSQLGPRYRHYVEEMLRSEVEGTCSKKYGYMITVVALRSLEKGNIQDGTGMIIVPVKYAAVVFRPYRGEVLDGVVTSVNKLGFFTMCGPLRVFVSRTSMPDYFEFKDNIYSDGETTIKVETEVRLKIQGVSYEPANIVAVGTINEDYLGPVETSDVVE